MNVKDLSRLLEAMQASNSNELILETGDYKLSINRSQINTVVSVAEPVMQASSVVQEVLAPVSVESAPEVTSTANDNLIDVSAPIVGTFYEAPAPDVSSFVKIGARVEIGDVLCIIEAMKLMNEIESEFSGTIAEILINNEDPVEYGQVLFRIKPD